MVLGEPYNFSIFIKSIDEWDDEEKSFMNGLLFLCIDGRLFPDEVVTATLKYEVPVLKDNLLNIPINNDLYNMSLNEAFIKIYHLSHPENYDMEEDDRYVIAPTILTDYGCFVFAVSNGENIRIMGDKLDYIVEESTYNLTDLNISETFIASHELLNIIDRIHID